jgi:hypothetical protein
MITFLEYINRTDDLAVKRLRVLKRALEQGGFLVKDFVLAEDDPHIFVYALPKISTFEGVRFYIFGDTLAFRPQKKVDTEPYGESYSFNVQDMFDDMMLEFGDDKQDKNKPVKECLRKMAQELRTYFIKSKKAEEELVKVQLSDIEDKDSTSDGIVINTTGTDYATKIYSKGN